MSQQQSNASQLSPIERFARLPQHERDSLLATLTDEQKAALAYKWDGWQARPNQLPPEGDWRFWLIMAGRGYGKTRIGAEELRKAARRMPFPNIIGATADDARDIMIEGESGILAICPPWERPDYQPSKRQLSWPNGAKTLIFTADEPERLRGKQHMWLWADELAAWRYPDAWDQAMFGLRLGDNPQAIITTTPKPTKLIRDLVSNPHCRVTRGSTYDNIGNLAPAFRDEIINKYEGTRLGRQELLGELLEDEGLAYQFSERIHVVKPFVIPNHWGRFESMDFGWSKTSATAWFAYATDPVGNVYVFDGLYEPGLPSELAPLVKRKRERWWEARDQKDRRIENTVWADPNTWGTASVTKFNAPTSAADEFAEHGVPLAKANNDRRAGYVRVSEMLRQDQTRVFPECHAMAGETGSPRLFIFDVTGTVALREQLVDAPVEEEGERFPGEAVSAKWESVHGHAHASLRYGVMSRPSPSVVPRPELKDPRAAFLRELNEREQQQAERSRRRRRAA